MLLYDILDSFPVRGGGAKCTEQDRYNAVLYEHAAAAAVHPRDLKNQITYILAIVNDE